MHTPESRAARAQVQHHAGVPPIRPASTDPVPFATRLTWAAQCFTSAHHHAAAGRHVEARIITAYGMNQLAALRAGARV